MTDTVAAADVPDMQNCSFGNSCNATNAEACKVVQEKKRLLRWAQSKRNSCLFQASLWPKPVTGRTRALQVHMSILLLGAADWNAFRSDIIADGIQVVSLTQ